MPNNENINPDQTIQPTQPNPDFTGPSAETQFIAPKDAAIQIDRHDLLAYMKKHNPGDPSIAQMEYSLSEEGIAQAKEDRKNEAKNAKMKLNQERIMQYLGRRATAGIPSEKPTHQMAREFSREEIDQLIEQEKNR